jgi:hypothetical protein
MSSTPHLHLGTATSARGNSVAVTSGSNEGEQRAQASRILDWARIITQQVRDSSLATWHFVRLHSARRSILDAPEAHTRMHCSLQ